MESRFWESFDDSDYCFETVFNESTENGKLLKLEITTSDGLQKTIVENLPENDSVFGVNPLDSPLDSFKQTNEVEAVGDEATNVQPLTDVPNSNEPLSSEGRPQESTKNQNFILWTSDACSGPTNFSEPVDSTCPPVSKIENSFGCKETRNYFQVMYDSMRIQQKIQSTASVTNANANANYSLPNWDVLINPFQYEQPVKLTIGDMHYYANYVKLVKIDGKPIYFKLLKNPSDCDMKSANLTLKFNNILWYFCAYTEIKISEQMEWNWHQNFPDSSSLFLAYPKNE